MVEGSVIQLYCSVESTTSTLVFSWTKDSSPLVVDVPRLRERTCSEDTMTTSVLTFDSFQFSDNGTYQCLANDGRRSGNGTVITLNSEFREPHGILEIVTLFVGDKFLVMHVDFLTLDVNP